MLQACKKYPQIFCSKHLAFFNTSLSNWSKWLKILVHRDVIFDVTSFLMGDAVTSQQL